LVISYLVLTNAIGNPWHTRGDSTAQLDLIGVGTSASGPPPLLGGPFILLLCMLLQVQSLG